MCVWSFANKSDGGPVGFGSRVSRVPCGVRAACECGAAIREFALKNTDYCSQSFTSDNHMTAVKSENYSWSNMKVVLFCH